MLDFRNTNTLWSSIIVETLYRLGLKTVILCPGSRSTPLTLAFAQHSHLKAIPVLDERSAAFFALGIAQKTSLPVALVCTSGTAGANFFPAIIEGKESRIPLLVFTADRPPELRHCHAGQTIDQVRLYGNYPNWQTELALPSNQMIRLRYLRQNIIQAWERSLLPYPGVVHLNVPFREPLAPIVQPIADAIKSQFQTENFFAGITTKTNFSTAYSSVKLPLEIWQKSPQGIIIAGVDQVNNPWQYCHSIARLSEYLGYPVLAEALSPLRNYAGLNPYLISTYDIILRNRQIAKKLTPEIVIQTGELPTSKELRTWLENINCQHYIINNHYDNFNPLHTNATHLRTSIEQINDLISPIFKGKLDADISEKSVYLQLWYQADQQIRRAIDQNLQAMDLMFEGKVAWLLSQTLAAATPIFIANSMSVRYAEFFWQPKNSGILPYFNRGANGIDGTLSTALGVTYLSHGGILLTGDLALLHDTNGFLLQKHFAGHLTIILINNQGGGIFEMLPIAQFESVFEDFFATPQNVDFAQLCATYNVEYKLIDNWQQLEQLLNPLPSQGIRLLEIKTNRKHDALWLQENLAKFASELSL